MATKQDVNVSEAAHQEPQHISRRATTQHTEVQHHETTNHHKILGKS